MTDPATARYPITGPRSFMDCPVHELAVALDSEGRISSSCPECVREAEGQDFIAAMRLARKRSKGNGLSLIPTLASSSTEDL